MLAWLCCISCVFFYDVNPNTHVLPNPPDFNIGLLVKTRSIKRERGEPGWQGSVAPAVLRSPACTTAAGTPAPRFRKPGTHQAEAPHPPVCRFAAAQICVQILSCSGLLPAPCRSVPEVTGFGTSVPHLSCFSTQKHCWSTGRWHRWYWWQSDSSDGSGHLQDKAMRCDSTGVKLHLWQ